jgi:hypothetical protein
MQAAMKRVAKFALLFMFAGPAFGQTCPTAANYTNPVTGAQNVTLASLGVMNCRFIDPVAGLDSNDGLSEASGHPWQHAPGGGNCTGNCAMLTPISGDGYIFEGGETMADTFYNLAHGGAGSTLFVYYGVDQSWFSGSSWNRPILAVAGTLPNQQSASPGFESIIWGMSAAWITLDNFEVTGMTCTSTVSQNYVWNANQYDGLIVLNHYFHDFEAPSSLCPVTTKLGDGQNAAIWLFNQISTNLSNCNGAFEFNVIDGTDGTGTKGYQTVVADGPGLCATVAYNVMHDVCSGITTGKSAHDNAVARFGAYVSGAFNCASSAGLHNHAIRSNGDLANATYYNNVLYQVGAEALSVNPHISGSPTLVYNNIFYDNGSTSIFVCDNGTGDCTNGYLTIFNNTFDQVTGGTGSPIQVENSISNLSANNNHCITSAGTKAACYVFNAGASAGTFPTPQGELYQTLTAANAAGYTSSQANVYSPTSTSSPTVGNGITGIAAGEAMATSYGVSQQTVNGVVKAVYPALTIRSRATSGTCTPGTPGCVDSGAYMFVNGGTVATPTCAPGNTTYANAAPQTVTCTIPVGATGCFTINGTPPVATTPGTCGSNAATYVSALTIYPSATIQILATEAGSTNSAVATYSYTSTYALGADNLYCPTVGGAPTWGANDGPAQLPVACFNTAVSNTPAPGSIVNVSTAAALTAALASAVCGQQITLTAGSTFSGNFTVPALNCAPGNWLWIVSSGYSSLPAEGTRITPCYAGITSLVGRPPFACPATPGTYTAEIITPNASPVLTFTSGTNGVRVMGIRFTRTLGTGFVAQLIKVGNVGTISNIIFDRDVFGGDEQQDQTEAAADLSTIQNVAVVDSFAYDFYCTSPGSCTDSHAFYAGLNNTNSTQDGPFKMVNDFVESAGEDCLLTGGGATNTTPVDFEIRLNTCFRPLTENPSDPGYNGGIGGDPWLVKNLFELKNTQRVLVEFNDLENTWGGFSQSGEAIKMLSYNQNCTSNAGANYNITFRYNRVTTAGQFLYGISPGNAAGCNSFGENSFSVHDNFGDNLNYATCYDCENNASQFGIWESPTINTAAQVLHDVSVLHNTAVNANGAAQIYGILGLSGPILPSAYAPYNITFSNNMGKLQNNNGTGDITGGTTTCAKTGTGAAMMTNCGYPVAQNNCLIDFGSATWPAGNITSLASEAVAYVAWNNGVGGNYTVASGACKGAATDGKDTGANFAAIAFGLAGNAAPGTIYPLALTVVLSGTVTSSPSGILCPTACTANFAAGSVISLTASPSSGFLFSGWSGACSGIANPTTVTMNAAEACTATFIAAPTVNSIKVVLGLMLTGLGIR